MNAHMMSRDKSCGAHIALHCVRTECCQENAMQDKPDRASQQHLRDQVKQKLEQVQHILSDLSRQVDIVFLSYTGTPKQLIAAPL